MQYIYTKTDNSDCYATRLTYRKSRRMLTWDSTAGIDTLVVEVPYGDDVAFRMESEIS